MGTKNWRTTATGVVTIVAAVLWITCKWLGVDMPQFETGAEAVGVISAGLTGLFARDAVVSSKQMGL